jgi:hypothetical protein
VKNIALKYKPGDKIYTIRSGDIRKAEIVSASATVEGAINLRTTIKYDLITIDSGGSRSGSKFSCNENRVYPSKKEAAYQWLTDQGLEPAEIIQGYFEHRKEEA